MPSFQKKKITQSIPENKSKLKRHIFTAFGVFFMLFFIYQAGAQVIDGISSTKVVKFFSGFFGKDLLIDENGHTNILLLGVGGEKHEGGTLTDSIIIASINHDKNSVALISIPRDFYVKSTLGSFRINQIFEEASSRWDEQQGLDFTKNSIQEIFDVPLHYVVKVDFRGVEAIVDAVNGIAIYVESPIYDPLYPKGETYDYETFKLARGLQHLDGKTALKYMRSRKSSSDFDRSRRQQDVLVALKQKALNENILKRASYIKDVYNSLNDNLSTTLTIREILALADFAKEWDSKSLSTATLNDEPIYTGGFLYTPLRSLYGGAFVLLPAGDNFDSMRSFASLVLYGPPKIKTYPLSILNGTGINGLAGKANAILNRYGANIIKVANGQNKGIETTTWYAQNEQASEVATALQKILPGKISKEVPLEYQEIFSETPNGILLELGNDSQEIISKLDIFRNIFQLTPTPTEPVATTEAPILPEPIQ